MEETAKAPIQDKTLVPTENLKKLHDNLSKREGFNVPLEQFEKDMQDESNLKRLHDNLAKQQDFTVPYDQFKADMFQPEATGTPPEPEQPLTYMQKELRQKFPENYTEEQKQVAPVQQPVQPLGKIDQLKVDYLRKTRGEEFANQEQAKMQATEQPEEQGFAGKLGKTVGNNFMTGMNSLNSWAADAPGFIYDLAGAPFRAVGLNVPTSQDFKDTPLQNISSFYKDNAKAYEQKVQEANPSRGQGVVASFEKGDIEGGILNLAGGIAESAPASIAMMLSGGATAPTILGGAAIFGAGKAQEMDRNAPEMDYDKRRVVAAINGTLEGIFETYLGSGAVGKSLAGIIKNEGKEVAQEQAKRSLSTVFADMITKNPWMAPLGDGFEEIGTQISQNLVDKYSGYKPDLDIMDGVGDSFLSGVGMGGIHGAVIGLAKSAMDTRNATPITTATIEGQQYTINNPEDLGIEGKPIFAKDADGKIIAVPNHKITDPVTQTQGEIDQQATDQQTLMQGITDPNAQVIHEINEDGIRLVKFSNGQSKIITPEGEHIANDQNEEDAILEKVINGETVPEVKEPAPEKKVVTQTIGNSQIDIIENEDHDEVVPTDKMPLEKALPILEKKFKDNKKFKVVTEKSQVEEPGETKYDEPIKRTVIKSIKIVPIGQNITENNNSENSNTENVSENSEQQTDNKEVENVDNSKSLQKSQLENNNIQKTSENEKSLESDPVRSDELGQVATQGEDTPSQEQGQGNEEGLEENVNISDILTLNSDGQTLQDAIDNVNNGLSSKTEGPILLTKIGDKYRVGDGFHRLAQAVINGDETINAEVFSEEFINSLKDQNISTDQPVVESLTADPVADEITQAAKEVNTNPTEAQKEAGNYKMAHITIQGMNITVENPKGSVRNGVDEDGKAWENILQSHYGYFKRTIGKDNDHIDTFIGDNPESQTIFVVDQNHPKTGAFDESKVMTGFNTIEEAKAAYLANYQPDWKGFGSITAIPVDQFKEWLNDGAKQHKPFSEYKDTPDPVDVAKPLTEEQKLRQSLNQIQDEFGVPARGLVKQFIDRMGIENINIERTINTARKILEIDPILKKQNMESAAIAEALQYETGYPDNFEDLRSVVKKGGYERNKVNIDRMLQVGVKVPEDILAMENITPEVKKPLSELLSDSKKEVENRKKQSTTLPEEKQNDPIKKLESENKSTLPKIPVGKIFSNDVQAIPREARAEADKFIESNTFDQLPVESVDVSDIIPTQKNVTISNIKEVANVDLKPQLLKFQGKYYVLDGHHRISNRILEGETTVEANVFDEDARLKAIEDRKKPLNNVLKEAKEQLESKRPKEAIVDFGEKLGGAKKDIIRKYLNKINLNGLTLSTIFPKPDIKELLASGMSNKEVSAIKVAYEFAQAEKKNTRRSKEIQIGAIRFCASYAKTVLSENLNIEFNNEGWVFTDHGKQLIQLRTSAFEKVAEELGTDFLSLDLSRFEIRELTPENTKHYVNKPEGNFEVQYYVNKRQYFQTLDEALNEFVDQVRKNTTANTVVYKRKLNIYYSRTGKGSYIGYQPSGKEVIILKDGFKNSTEAFEYKKENEADLQTMLERIMAEQKEANKKQVTRLKYYNETTRERVGNDWRKGKDIPVGQFADTFGFKSVEFGNWATQAERQVFLNNVYDSLMDLTEILNVPAKALSLNGELSISFGSRGSGGALAHYEPERKVINLTKNRGIGSLAHEFFHGLDNYFAGFKSSMKGMKSSVAGESMPETRQELKDQFRKLYDAFGSGFKSRSRSLDDTKNKNYFGLPHEMAARAFENYILNKLSANGQVNDFLVNYVSNEDWNGIASQYPYPIGEESKAIGEVFDNLFSTIETKEEGDNVPMFRIIGEKGAASIDLEEEVTTRLDNLAVAREMESSGKDAKSIRLATGWEKGADGKWRYEVPDNIKPKRYVDKAKFAQAKTAYERIIELNKAKDYDTDRERLIKILEDFYKTTGVPYYTGDQSIHNALRTALLEDKPELLPEPTISHNIEFWQKKRVDGEALLEDVIDNEQMYNEYPFLRYVGISFKNIDSKGSYSPGSETIVISDRLKGYDEEVKSTMLHEIQHAIQYFEGFAKGGNLQSGVAELYDRINKQLNDLAREMNNLTVPGNYGKFSDPKGYELKEKYDALMQEKLNANPYDYYKRLAGEVESRNVQTRMNMTPEERRNALLQETEDVAREDQIVLMDGLGVSSLEESNPIQSTIDHLQSTDSNPRKVNFDTKENLIQYMKDNDYPQSILDQIELINFGGVLIRGEIFMDSGNVNTPDKAVINWLHERTHIQTAENMTRPELVDFYHSIGPKEIRRVIPSFYWNKPYYEQADEYISYASEELSTYGELDQNIPEHAKEIITNIVSGFTTPKNLKDATKSNNLDDIQSGNTRRNVRRGNNDGRGNQESEGTSEIGKDTDGRSLPENAKRSSKGLTVSTLASQDLSKRHNASNIITKLSNELGEEISVLNSSELPENAKDSVVLYDNGKLTIVSDRIKSVSDVVKSILHEVAVEKGLRNILAQADPDSNIGRQLPKFDELNADLSKLTENSPETERLAQIFRKAFSLTGSQFTNSDLLNIVKDQNEQIAFKISGLYHGSPHSFDKFTTDKIGTGEGAQAYGWGLYFTDKKEIAEGYANKLVMKDVRVGKTTAIALDQKYDNPAFLWMLDYVHGRGWNKDQIINELANQLSDTDWIEKNKWVEKNIKQAIEILSKPENDIEPLSEPRNLYSTTLHEGKTPEQYDYLRWDKPVSREQQGKIFKQLREEKIFPSNNGSTQKFWQGNSVDWEIGSNIYDLMANTLGSEKKASEFLLRAGIDGIKYPSEYLSKGSREDSFNYVVFDENAVTVEEHAMFRTELPETILVDGKERSTLNSNGKPIANSEGFKKWFSGSKITDKKGKPLVVFHGTDGDFNEFESFYNQSSTGASFLGSGFYFTDSKTDASHYGKNIVPVYLSIKNPYDFTSGDFVKDFPNLSTKDGTKFSDILSDRENAVNNVKNVEVVDDTNGFKRIYWEINGEVRSQRISPLELTNDETGTQKAISLSRKYAESLPRDISPQLLKEELIKNGYDGVISDGTNFWDSGKEYVAFNPSQIKSATGNNGSFNPESNDIRFRVEQAVEDLNKINSLPKSKQDAIAQIKEDFDSTKSLFKSIENLKEMEESKVGKKVAERRVVIKQISAYKKGYRAGVAEKRLTLQVIQRNIIKYANDNMNYDDATRFEITQLLTAIKNANTPATIEKVFDKIDELASRGLKRKLMNRIERAIKYASPKLQSGKPTGKTSPEAYQAISKIKQLMAMTSDEYDNYLELIADNDVESMAFASVFGNLKEKSIDETFEALKILNSIISDGRTWYKDKIEALKTRHKELIKNAVDDITGGKGIQSTQNIRSESGVVDKNSYFKEFLGKNQSFEWLLDLISNNKKDRTGWGFMQDHFGDLANKSENLESKGLRESIELVNKKAFEIFGKEKSKLAKIFGENSRAINKSGVTYAANDGRKEIPMSQNEAYKRWMEMSDPTLFPTFEKMGWDSQSLKELEKFLDPKVLAWAKWQITEFFPEYYKRVNEVYKKMYYVDLPFNPSYSGFLKRERTSVGDKEDTLLRPDTLIQSVANSSLKSRVKNIRDIVLQDGDQALAKHIAEMEHFMAWAETIREIRAVLSSDSVQDAIKKEHGNNIRTVLNERINSLVRGGVDRGEVNYLVDWVRKNYVTSALGVNISLTPKQMTAMFSYLNDISIMDYIKGAAEFMANPAQSIEILSQSEFVQRRYKKGWTHEIEAAMKKNNPNTLAGTKSVVNSIRDALMLPVMLGDKFAVYSGYPVYAKFYKQFKAENPTASEMAAHDFALNKFERVTKRTQQSSDVSDTSRFQETSFGKVFMMFKNAQQQYFRYEMAAINNLIKGKGNTLENAKIILITHVVLPVIFQMVANWFTDEDDDKENKRLLRAALLGPIDGLMIAGDIIGYGFEKMMGEKWSYSASPMLDTVQDLGNSIQQLVKYINEPYPENEAEDLQKALDFAIQFTSSTMTGVPYEPAKKIYKKVTGGKSKVKLQEDASEIIGDAEKYIKFIRESAKRDDTELYNKLISDKELLKAVQYLNGYNIRITRLKKAIKINEKNQNEVKAAELQKKLEETYQEIVDKYSDIDFPNRYKLSK